MIRVTLATLLGCVIVVCIGIALGFKLKRSIRYERAHDAWRREQAESD